jgi:hypothetical protein
MIGRQSAYAELGLKPGADRAQIDEAYRRLIKLHHPDRPGGNGERAAQINRAYRELRNQPPDTLPVQVQPPFRVRAKRPRFRLRALAAISVAAGAILVLSRNLNIFHSIESATAVPAMAASRDDSSPGSVTPLDDLQEPLSKSAIDRSAADALDLYQRSNPASLAGYSRGCQAQFRDHPDVVWFDACAAFDEAVVLLQSRDPAADSGPFNPAAVTSREMGAAGILSDDSLAADSRLRQIRSRVEIVLLSKLPQ